MRILRLNVFQLIDSHPTFISHNIRRMSASNSASSSNDSSDSLTRGMSSSRKWVVVNHRRPDSNDTEFNMVSWNLLARDLIQRHFYLYQDCSNNACHWPNRCAKILKYLFNNRKQYKIICLQELNYLDYENDFLPFTRDKGYKSIYEKRSNDIQDGCAIFYHADTFELDSYNIVHLGNPRVIVDTRKQRPNIAIIASFRPKMSGVLSNQLNSSSRPSDDKFVVATTHLLFNPRRGDIKVCQLRFLLAELWKTVTFKLENGAIKQWPLILCGDFNLQPNSHIYNFIVNRKMNPVGLKTGDLSGQFDGIGNGQYIANHHNINLPALTSDSCFVDQETDTSEGSSSGNDCEKSHQSVAEISGERFSGFSHKFRFTPVYPCFHATSGEALASSSVQDEVSLVDYIFYTQKESCYNMAASLSLISFYDLPTQSQLKSYGPLPNFYIPSDHLPLEARFLFHPNASH